MSVLNEARLNNAHFYKRQREENQLYDDKINQLVLAAESSKSRVNTVVTSFFVVSVLVGLETRFWPFGQSVED